MIQTIRAAAIPACDIDAERFVVAAWLWGRRCDDLDPGMIVCEGRRALLLAADAARAEGTLFVAPTADPIAELQAAYTNGEFIASLVQTTGVWPYDVDPRYEVAKCLGCTSMPGALPYFVARLERAHWRRGELTRLERRVIELVSEAWA